MATATVSGFTTADIHSAASQAGAGGDVYFPAGEYASDELQVLAARQTWTLHPDAVIKRTSGTASFSIIKVLADGWRLRGGTLDGNRANNAVVASGIIAEGFSIDMREFTLRNVMAWGIYQKNAKMVLIDFTVKGGGLAGIFWFISADSVTQAGPHIERGNIDMSVPADYIDSGCIAIIGHAVKRGIAPRVIDTRMACYNPTWRNPNNSGGLGIFHCDHAIVRGNETVGGRMSISILDAHFAAMTGNVGRQHSSYFFEIVKSNYVAIAGNTMRGAPGVTGVENNSSNYTKVSGNAVAGCSRPIRLYKSVGVKHDFF